MLGTIFSYLGGAVGKYLGGGILSTLGRHAGKYLGNILEKEMLNESITNHKFANIRDSFTMASAYYGEPIALIWGKAKVLGKIIWADELTKKYNISRHSHYIAAKYLTITDEISEIDYYLSFAIAICEGPITELGRVWNGNKLVNINRYKFRLYKGDEKQMSDPLMQAKIGPCSGHRGLAYIVFDELPLADFGNMVPNLSFEVYRVATTQESQIEHQLKAMVMIPGSGEYIYDTILQEKTVTLEGGGHYSEYINSHNYKNIADSIHSLDQLQATCPKVNWVAPVVSWFANTLDLDKCEIKPSVEFKDNNTIWQEEWRVGKYNRLSAHEISKDANGCPNYGGTVNDASLVRYLKELKARGLNIMFYPMIFVDLPNKPWRGHLTGDGTEIIKFFQKPSGYNEFILHYANLVKDHIDAFIIGSEFIGLTKVQTQEGRFPAVEQLVLLSKKLRPILGKKVKISYAADWSEYHHTAGGWFNLDSLWASDDIDFVGIDAYFPLTDSMKSNISYDEIKRGFESGECYDYFYQTPGGEHKRLSEDYAAKNIGYWWSNRHKNPDGQYSLWQPKSKPIWFTEFGFPSIDKATNQPNIFYDLQSLDGGAPRYSNENTDLTIQRRAIKAFIEYWSDKEYIGQMFLWAWDARPYPAWPCSNIWYDNHLWEKGHWVNFKFGANELSAIILEISKRCGLNAEKINVKDLDTLVQALAITKQTSAIAVINMLRALYFFDMSALMLPDHDLSFDFRFNKVEKQMSADDLVAMKIEQNNSYLKHTNIAESEILSKLQLSYITNNYQRDCCYVSFDRYGKSYGNKEMISFHVPVILNMPEARSISEAIINNAHAERQIIEFDLPEIWCLIKPGDFIILQDAGVSYRIRVTELRKNHEFIYHVSAVTDRICLYHDLQQKNTPLALAKRDQHIEDMVADQLSVFALPFVWRSSESCLIAAFSSIQSSYLYITDQDSMSGRGKLSMLNPDATILKLISLQQNEDVSIMHIDNSSNFILEGEACSDFSMKFDQENGFNHDWHIALLGSELISFRKITAIARGKYKITESIRGLYGTQDHIKAHHQGEKFILLDQQLAILPMTQEIEGKNLTFECGSAMAKIENVKFTNASITLPYIKNHIKYDNNLIVDIIYRTQRDLWREAVDPLLSRYKFILKLHVNDGSVSEHVIHNMESQIKINLRDVDISDGYYFSIIAREI